jgi:hypothetical protein
MNGALDPFEGNFRVTRTFQCGARIAQPGETITLVDRHLARELLDLGRVECSRKTLEALGSPRPCAPLRGDGVICAQ